LETARRKLRNASRQLNDTILQADFVVPDMHCISCISSIERSLLSLAQVEKTSNAEQSLVRLNSKGGMAVPLVHVIGANRLFKECILMREGSALNRT